MQSVHINTKVVSSNPVHGEVYSIQHHGIKLIENPGPTLRQTHNIAGENVLFISSRRVENNNCSFQS